MRLLLLILTALILNSCADTRSLVEQIKQDGELVVVTRYGPTTFYEARGEATGLEHDLVKLFAEKLGVEVRFVIPETFEEVLSMVESGEVHFAAAGLTVTRGRESRVRFGPEYQKVHQQLVYHSGNRRPRSIGDTTRGALEVVAGSSHEEALEGLKSEYPGLHWKAQRELDSWELLKLVKEKLIDYTIADSTEVSLSRRFHPELKVALNISAPQSLAWAFPHGQDSSLYNRARKFLKSLKSSGKLDKLIERYYGYTERLGFVDTRNFRRHMASRLPALQPLFEEAARQTGLEWQLLAAIGYQESHWNPNAVSPTGVRGIMMLTQATAEQLGVENRLDPRESILGGARYIRIVEEKIPERIPEPDRLWLTLAGYNVGFGHLEDARILTQRLGGNPDTWSDIKKYLPLLSQEKYYKKLKRGYARGREPVDYVDKIRGYYELLIWEQENAQNLQSSTTEVLSTTPGSL